MKVARLNQSTPLYPGAMQTTPNYATRVTHFSADAHVQSSCSRRNKRSMMPVIGWKDARAPRENHQVFGRLGSQCPEVQGRAGRESSSSGNRRSSTIAPYPTTCLLRIRWGWKSRIDCIWSACFCHIPPTRWLTGKSLQRIQTHWAGPQLSVTGLHDITNIPHLKYHEEHKGQKTVYYLSY